MALKAIKDRGKKVGIQDPAFPNDPTKTIEVDAYEVEELHTLQVTRPQLEQRKAVLEAELAEVNNFLAQIDAL